MFVGGFCSPFEEAKEQANKWNILEKVIVFLSCKCQIPQYDCLGSQNQDKGQNPVNCQERCEDYDESTPEEHL